jgi:hypothetical protein
VAIRREKESCRGAASFTLPIPQIFQKCMYIEIVKGRWKPVIHTQSDRNLSHLEIWNFLPLC